MTVFATRPAHTGPAVAYSALARESAALVIRRYSSSFGLASRLLGEPVRSQVRDVYALVRVADEIVDHPDPRLGPEPRGRMLSWLHEDVRQALHTGYSPNLVVHAFAQTARACGIGEDLIVPFFASMARDLDPAVHTRESVQRYIYGSAEVVGLMCLRVFLTDDPANDRDVEYDRLSPGAQRLGAAFQKLNFLRDLGEDHDVLGRAYFPGVDVDRFSDADRDAVLDDIATDLAAAAGVVPDLPASSRRAVRVAHAVFAELAERLRATPAAQIRRSRVSVPDRVKLRLVVGALYADRA